MLVLVDERDGEIGQEEKLAARRRGALHRAVSVTIANPRGEILIQRRAHGKYHSAGLWSNACCSHPYPGEAPLAAARRRLGEEMGFDCELTFGRLVRYSSNVGGGLIENELVHFFSGVHDGTVQPDAGEVGEYAWVEKGTLYEDVRRRPEDYSAWFRIYVAVGVI